MQFISITKNQQKFTLDQSGKQVFFLHNQSGDFVFELNEPGAEAYIFALFTGKNDDEFQLRINQVHNAPKTVSHVLVKFLGDNQSTLKYEGLIHIERDAIGSEASQKNINLLLSDESKAYSFPSLEILTDDVICHHGATTSRINTDHLFYAQSRGLSPKEAEHMLANGFVNEFFLEIGKLGTFKEMKKYE